MIYKYTEHIFDKEIGSITSYDSNITLLGSLFTQESGTHESNCFVSPLRIGIARYEHIFYQSLPSAIYYDETEDWIFQAELTAGVNRRISFWKYNKKTFEWSHRGVIKTGVVGIIETVRGLRAVLDEYVSGSVSSNGSSLTIYGTDTQWQSSNLCSGNRIGFGSNTRTGIDRWYEIASIDSDSQITLSGDNVSLSSGTPYVIQDLRIVMSCFGGVSISGGIFVAKGLRPELFTPIETQIPSGGTTDNQTGVYWLKDAPTVSNTGACGCAIDVSKTDWNTHYVYVVNSITGPKTNLYKYNIRQNLNGTLESNGGSTASHVLTTATQEVQYAPNAYGNGIITSLNHGPEPLEPSLYYIANRGLQRINVKRIKNNANWTDDAMSFKPPGGTQTFYLDPRYINTVDDSGILDKLILMSTHANSSRSLVSKYYSDGGKNADGIFEACTFMLHNNSGGVDRLPKIYNPVNVSTYISIIQGMMYVNRTTTITTYQQMFAIPIGADWLSAEQTNQRIITPKLYTERCKEFQRVYVNNNQSMGTGVSEYPTDPYRIYYRIHGIDNNTGKWIPVPVNGIFNDGVNSESIQFMLEFKTLGMFMNYPKIYSLGIAYVHDESDDNLLYSQTKSDPNTKEYVWWFKSAYGTIVPELEIKIYDQKTDAIIFIDSSASSLYGNWYKSIDSGATWNTYDDTDLTNTTTYLKYSATALYDNIQTTAILYTK